MTSNGLSSSVWGVNMNRWWILVIAAGCAEAEDPAVWTAEYEHTDPSALSRLRAANYYFTAGTADPVFAEAPHCVDNVYDTATFDFSLTVTQAMLNQFAAIFAAGGHVEVIYTTQAGNSFKGNGSGDIGGAVLVELDGQIIGTPTHDDHSGNGTLRWNHVVPLTSTELASATVGSMIRVEGAGDGTASSNGCDLIDQAIVTWEFTAGVPILKTYP